MLPVNPLAFLDVLYTKKSIGKGKCLRNTMSFYLFNFDANLFQLTIFCVQNGANILLFVVVFNNNKG